MRTLILGAGVIGSFNAAPLTDAGQDITPLARGRRLEGLHEHGIVLEDFRTGRRTINQGSIGGSARARRALESEHRRVLPLDNKLGDWASESSATGTPTCLLALHQWGCSMPSSRDQQRHVIGLFARRVLLHGRNHGLQ